jgi:putative endonuclease
MRSAGMTGWGTALLYYVYVLASSRRGTLYVGVTNDVVRRVFEHRSDLIGGFTAKYGVHRLVYFETHQDVREAIAREKRVKRWRRAWKIELIEKDNGGWDDLWPALSSSPAEPTPSVIPAERDAREPGPMGHCMEMGPG